MMQDFQSTMFSKRPKKSLFFKRFLGLHGPFTKQVSLPFQSLLLKRDFNYSNCHFFPPNIQDFFSGLSEGQKICLEASGDSGSSSSLLVPHPTDCTKFYNCQPLTNGRYIAHEQSCPPTTGFDATLQICNFIDKLPRCRARKKKHY